MSKVGKKKRVNDNQAFAKARHIRGGERKLNLLAQLIRGKHVQKALIDLEFSHRRMANDVKKVLAAAIANAENNHGLDVDRLFVSEATVGKTMVMKRFSARARGRSSAIEKPFSNITIIVEEGSGVEEPKKGKGKKKAAAKTADAKPAKKEEKVAEKKSAAKTPAKKKAAAKKDDSKATK